MDSDSSQNTTTLYGTSATLRIPERSEWSVNVLSNVVYTPEKGKEPNWFHRKMQELCFGFKWHRTK